MTKGAAGSEAGVGGPGGALRKAAFRVGAGGLALLAAAVAVTGDFAVFRAYVSEGDQAAMAAAVNPLFEGLWTAEVLLACALALAIVWRAAARPDARSLAWFLVFFSLAGFERALEGTGVPPAEWASEGVLASAGGGALAGVAGVALAVAAATPWWLALAAFIRFAALFQRPLTPAEVERAGAGEWTARLLDARQVWAAAWVFAAVTGVAGLTLQAGTERVGVPLGMLAFALVLASLAVFVWGIVQGARLLRIRYRTAGVGERRQILWVVQGFWLATWLILVGIAALAPAAIAVLGGGGWIWPAVPVLAIAAAPLVIFLFLAVAIFYDGALDPALVVRRTALYGAFGVVLTFAFAAVESLASGWLVGRAGLPEGSAGWIAAGAVTVLFGVARHALARRLGRLVAPLVPEASPGVTRSPVAGYTGE